MGWSDTLPQLAWGLLWLSVPGLALGWAIGLRAWRLLFAAPALSVSIVASAAVLVGFLHIPFTPVSALLGALPIVAAAFGVRVVLTRRFGPDRAAPDKLRMDWWIAVGALLAALSVAWQVKNVIGPPTAISQSYDVMFHLNALRYIADTGNGSSLLLGGMVTSAGGLYPAAWHDLGFLIWAAAGNSIPVATNALTVLAAAVVWPAGVALLASTLRLRNHAAALGMGIAAACVGAFPLLMLKWGILYPNLLGYAILPAALGAVAWCLRGDSVGRPAGTIAWLLAVAVAPGLVLSHPSALLALIAFLFPLLAWAAGTRLLRGVRNRETGDLLAGVALALALVVAAVAWRGLRPGGDLWPPVRTDAQALGEFLTNAPMGYPAAWLTGALTLLGAWWTLRHRSHRFLTAAWLVSGVLWIFAAGVERGPLRDVLVGGWYGDPHRLASLTAVAAVPLIGLGVGAVCAPVLAWGARAERPWAGVGVALLVPVLFGLAASGSASMVASQTSAAREFELTKDSLLITADEQAVLDRVDEFVPQDATILVNPWDGSPVVYALEDRKVTQFHSLSERPHDLTPVYESLADAARRPEVCAALRADDVHFYLDFVDTLNIGGPDNENYAALDRAVKTKALTPLFTSGDVGLYRIAACD